MVRGGDGAGTASTVSATSATARIAARRSLPPTLDALRRVVTHPVGAIFGTVILIVMLLAVFAPIIAPYDPIATSREKLLSPSWKYPFGTDNIGRDQLSRIIWGARISLYVGLIAVGLGTVSGTVLGLVSGFLGGTFDLIVQRAVDGMLAIPAIVLAMAIVSVLGANTANALLAIAIVTIPSSSRVVRSAVLAVKANVYVEAAHALGATPRRIMARHVLPNIVAPILILASGSLGGAILAESGLSFLGLGTQPPNPSWGLMLSTSGRQYMESAPWLAILPGLAISVTVLSFNMLGDTIRDVLDPRLRGSR